MLAWFIMEKLVGKLIQHACGHLGESTELRIALRIAEEVLEVLYEIGSAPRHQSAMVPGHSRTESPAFSVAEESRPRSVSPVECCCGVELVCGPVAGGHVGPEPIDAGVVEGLRGAGSVGISHCALPVTRCTKYHRRETPSHCASLLTKQFGQRTERFSRGCAGKLTSPQARGVGGMKGPRCQRASHGPWFSCC